MSLHVKGKKAQGRRPVKKEAVTREEGRDDKIQSLTRQEGTGSTACENPGLTQDSSHSKRRKGRNNVCKPR